jgi:hypothetical protein
MKIQQRCYRVLAWVHTATQQHGAHSPCDPGSIWRRSSSAPRLEILSKGSMSGAPTGLLLSLNDYFWLAAGPFSLFIPFFPSRVQLSDTISIFVT